MFESELTWLKEYLARETNYGPIERTIRARYPKFHEYIINSWILDTPPKNFVERVYQMLHPTDVICPYGKRMRFEYYSSGYRCVKTCPCVREKHHSTMLARHGVAYALQNDEFKDKAKATLLKNYGTDIISMANAEQRKATCMERYGAETPLQSDTVRTRIDSTMVSKYGVRKPFQLAAVQEQSKQTVLARYGTASAIQSEEVRARADRTVLERYGVKNVSQKHLDPVLMSELNNDERFIEVYNSMPSVSKVQEYFGICVSSVHQRASRLNLPRKRTLVSAAEQQVADFIRSYVPGLVQSDRTVIKPREIDILLPELKLGIEFDGAYMHSTKFSSDRNAMLRKTQQAEAAGYRLVHIISDEWEYKRDIVQSRLLSILGITQRIHARKTVVKFVPYSHVHEFLQCNHIQGAVVSSINLAMYHGDEIVAVMTFSPSRYDKTYDYELVRYCTKLGCTVVGGPSKLLAHFKRHYAGSIMSYADRRWSKGDLYAALGFKFIRHTAPNYTYLIGNKRESRNKYQKHRLSKLLANFDPALSEQENMKNHGYYRVYDCGNSVWGLDK